MALKIFFPKNQVFGSKNVYICLNYIYGSENMFQKNKTYLKNLLKRPLKYLRNIKTFHICGLGEP